MFIGLHLPAITTWEKPRTKLPFFVWKIKQRSTLDSGNPSVSAEHVYLMKWCISNSRVKMHFKLWWEKSGKTMPEERAINMCSKCYEEAATVEGKKVSRDI